MLWAKAQAAPGAVVSDAPVEELMALHKQVRSEAREQTKFDLARPPKAWLCALRGSNAGEDRPRPLPPPSIPTLGLRFGLSLAKVVGAVPARPPPLRAGGGLLGRR